MNEFIRQRLGDIYCPSIDGIDAIGLTKSTDALIKTPILLQKNAFRLFVRKVLSFLLQNKDIYLERNRVKAIAICVVG